jgi:hypothetical protein
MAPRRQSKRGSSTIIGWCCGASRESGSPWRKSSGSTMHEESCRSGGSPFVSAR